MKKHTGPILLILIGTLLLLSNLDILPINQLKTLLRTWWPALIIFVGVIQLITRR